MRRFFVILIAITAAADQRLGAAEGRIPIYQPTIITEPGHYVLTSDIQVASGDVVIIEANDVTVNLNGRSISSSATSGAMIAIGVGRRNVNIRNGRLSGGAYGIYYDAPAAPTRVQIQEVEVLEAATYGIYLENVDYVEITNCAINGPGDGMEIRGSFTDHFTGRIVGNTIDEARYLGIYLVNGDALEVRRNVVTDYNRDGLCCGAGIAIAGTGGRSGGHLVEGNTIQGGGPNSTGLLMSNSVVLNDNSLIANNVISGSGAVGMVVDSSGSRIVGNVVAANGSHGIRIFHNRNLIERNQVEGNAGNGLFFVSGGSSGNAYRENMLRGNTLGAVSNTGGAAVATDAGGNIL